MPSITLGGGAGSLYASATQGEKADSAVQAVNGIGADGTGGVVLEPADIGAATSAEGALAVTAVQPAALAATNSAVAFLKLGAGINAAEYGFLPGEAYSATNAAAFKAAMDAAIAADTYVNVPNSGADVYYITAAGLSGTYFLVREAVGFGLLGNGAELRFVWDPDDPTDKPTIMFWWVDLARAFFRDFKIDWEPYLSTQGVVTAVSGSSITFTVDEGLEPAFDTADYIVVFDEGRNTVLSRNTHNEANIHDIVNLGGGSYRVDLTTGTVAGFFPGGFALGVGHVVAVVCRKRECNFFLPTRCPDLILEDLQIMSHDSDFIVGGDNERLTLRRVRAGSNDARLVSTGSGFVNMSHIRGDIVIEDCVFDGCGDDPINFHTRNFAVTAATSGEFTFTADFARGDNGFVNVPIPRVGDLLAIQPPDTEDEITARITAVSTPAATTAVQSLTITIDAAIPAGFDTATWEIMNINLTGEPVYTNLTIHRTTARGVLYASSKGRILGYTFTGSFGAAIAASTPAVGVSNDIPAGFRGGLTVSNFYFDDVCTSPAKSQLIADAAISLFVGADQDPGTPISAPSGWEACAIGPGTIRRSRSGGISATGIDINVLGAIDLIDLGENRTTDLTVDYDSDVYAEQATIFGAEKIINRNAVPKERKAAGGAFLSKQLRTDDGPAQPPEYTPPGKLLYTTTLASAAAVVDVTSSNIADIADYDTLNVRLYNLAHNHTDVAGIRFQMRTSSALVNSGYISTASTVSSSLILIVDAAQDTPHMVDLTVRNFQGEGGALARFDGAFGREGVASLTPGVILGRMSAAVVGGGFRLSPQSGQFKIGTVVEVRGYKSAA